MADELELDCNGDAVDLGQRGLRIASIFIIGSAALFGAMLPVLLARQSKMHVPKFTFFICKYIGTGVIIATAWMHLLEPAVENLSDPCLQPRLGDYPWAFFIGLMTIMMMFLVELLASSADPVDESHSHGSSFDTDADPSLEVLALSKSAQKNSKKNNTPFDNKEALAEPCPHVANDVERNGSFQGPDQRAIPGPPDDVSYPPGGQDHLGHAREHKEGDSHTGLAGQLTAIFILEFGVVFHSIFIGLTLGTTDNLVILLIVLVFHQLFEGLGLGSRLALAHWPEGKKWLPYVLAGLFALSTPVGIAAAMGARINNANTQKLVNGIFDAISSGILMYTGLVELLAHEFMFNPHMRRAPLKIQLFAFGCVLFGVGVMATLANWA